MKQEGETGMSEMDIERLKAILKESDYVHAEKWTGEAIDIEGLIDVALDALAERERRIGELEAANERMREAINILIDFIPDGWEMPLGYAQIVAQAQAAKEAQSGQE